MGRSVARGVYPTTFTLLEPGHRPAPAHGGIPHSHCTNRLTLVIPLHRREPSRATHPEAEQEPRPPYTRVHLEKKQADRAHQCPPEHGVNRPIWPKSASRTSRPRKHGVQPSTRYLLGTKEQQPRDKQGSTSVPAPLTWMISRKPLKHGSLPAPPPTQTDRSRHPAETRGSTSPGEGSGGKRFGRPANAGSAVTPTSHKRCGHGHPVYTGVGHSPSSCPQTTPKPPRKKRGNPSLHSVNPHPSGTSSTHQSPHKPPDPHTQPPP